MITLIIQGGHQEDAEEFFALYFDTLEELLAMLVAISAPPPSTPANTRKNTKLGSVTGTTSAASAYMESESVVSHEDADGDGWLGVGNRNQTVVTRMICLLFFVLVWVVSRFFFSISLLPSIPPSLHLACLLACLLPRPFTRLLIGYSPTHR